MSQEKTKIEYPEVILGAVIVNSEGRLLLGKSNKCKDKYAIVGGHLEYGESMREAVKREVKEEAGIDVEVRERLGFNESIFNSEFNQNKHYIFLDYLCYFDGKDDDVKMNEEFQEEFGWFTLEEAKKLDLAKGTRKVLEIYEKHLQSQEYLAGWKRCMADFENYKRRQMESQKDLSRYGIENMILEILPVVDNFYASTDHIPEDQKDGSWVQGIMYIQKQLENVLSQNGVTEIATKIGDEFDPTIHEAMGNGEDVAKEKGNKIGKILQKGYKIGEKVIRPTRVIVN